MRGGDLEKAGVSRRDGVDAAGADGGDGCRELELIENLERMGWLVAPHSLIPASLRYWEGGEGAC